MLERSSKIFNMNRLGIKNQAQIIRCLVDGNSLRATTRITGVSRTTIIKLLADVGKACSKYQDKALRNLPCKRIECDEIWSFCYSKQKNVPEKHQGKFGFGDVWTWTAICSDTKLIPSWFIGKRDADSATIFMKDLASRLANRVQLTTDGLRAYVEAVEEAFGSEVDYEMLVKIYGNDKDSVKRYGPAKCIGIKKEKINGNPVQRYTSTSYVERANLTLRMNNRRYTRLTNGFSKKIENLAHAVSLHFMYYNFCRIHQTLRVTPAMEAGVSDHVWEVEEILELLNKN
ncbi:MAG: IS1 family transposase [Gammaproteobacteria bacterium]|jgi:IS1 family transposase|nr:IS1 family transposase [Gammaproteobacteria bacterium]|tara:strand:+ start:2785 stop:3645 length:861 start_codon:yes stop_codon:yes gene_type:complete